MNISTIIIKMTSIFGVLMNVGCMAPHNKRPLQAAIADSLAATTDILSNTQEKRVFRDTTYKLLGLDSFYASAGKIELRLKVTAYPWLEDKMLQIKFAPTDTTATIFRYQFAEASTTGTYIAQKITPKIPWKAVADSLARFDLLTLPKQSINESVVVLDGQNYTIQFTDRNMAVERTYKNPGVYPDSANKKVTAFLDFIDRSVSQVFHTVMNEKRH
jgi:hypothetical protein